MASPTNVSLTSAELAIVLSMALWDQTAGNEDNPLIGSPPGTAAFQSLQTKLEAARVSDGTLPKATGISGNVGS